MKSKQLRARIKGKNILTLWKGARMIGSKEEKK